MKKKVLVVAAHPDDEVLGCGATMARHANEGDEVHSLFLAEGVTARDPKPDLELRGGELAHRRKAAFAANKILGTRSVNIHEFPDNRMDAVDRLDVIKIIEALIRKVRPDTIYTHHAGDVNMDHRIVHDAVIAACRPFPSQSVRTLLFFEVPSSTEWQVSGDLPRFAPDWFVDVSLTFKRKTRALMAYGDEMRPWPHARSLKAIEHLARWRGATIGVDAAEAFVLGRKIVLR